jgi:serine protease Do
VENSGDLPRMVGMAKPGTRIQMDIWRKGKTQQLGVVLGELPVEARAGSKDSKSPSRGGLVLSELSAEQRRALDIEQGVLVEDATGDAARSGIRTGDVILAVNNIKIASVAGFRKAVAAVPVGKSVAILIRRGEGSLYIPLKITGE